MEFKHKRYSKYLRVIDGPKQYGIINRASKQFFRNYHRELKNGKGLSFLDIITLKMTKIYKEMPIIYEKLVKNRYETL